MTFQPYNHHNDNNNNNPSFTPPPPLKKTWLNVNTESFNHMVLAMQLHSLSDPKSKTLTPNFPSIDPTLLLSDEILLKILSNLPDSQRNSISLVCKRWLNLQGRLVRSLRVFDFNFVLSGRLVHRFPNLSHIDLVPATFLVSPQKAAVLVTHRVVSFHVDAAWCFGFTDDDVKKQNQNQNMLPVESVELGLKEIAKGCPNLRKLQVTGAGEEGLVIIGEECSTLQELELHSCNGDVLRGVSRCVNLQVVKLIGTVNGFYESLVSDIGLTILAQGCKRLVKLELCGCEGSFDGIKAIGKCCVMLEELVFVDHRMDDGWLAGVSFCENLKTLRFVSCKVIDGNPGLEEHLGVCGALERLHFQKCQLRDKNGVGAVFSICRNVKEVILQDCWGLDDAVFCLAVICRRLKMLSLEGCSLLTTESLESVINAWKELVCLRVVSCKNIKDSDISPSLATLFTTLKELKWRPDTKHLLQSCLGDIGMAKRGGRFFKRTSMQSESMPWF